VSGFSGDGGAATSAQVDLLLSITINGSDIYLADCFNNRIRKINSSGIISTVAGNGTAGYTGDGGAATSAELYNPCGATIDAAGNMYIADYSNHLIRKVDASGIITTYAGTGVAGFSGDGGPANVAELNNPYVVVFDSYNNMYISDRTNSRIRKITSCIQPTLALTASTNSICAGNSATLSVSGASTYSWSQGGTGATQVVSPSVTTIYTVSGIGSNSCFNSSSITLSVSAPPTLNLYASDNAICSGHSATLSVSGASTYSWSQGGTSTSIVVSPSVTTNYIVTGFGSNSCFNSSSITVSVSPQPTLTLAASANMICAGQLAAFSASGASSYSWSQGATGTAVVVSPSVTTSYTVTGFASAACFNSSSITLSVSACTGLSELANQKLKVKLFPNPSAGALNLQVESEFETGELILFNSLGEKVYDQTLTNGKSFINAMDLGKGLYSYVLVQDNTRVAGGKLVIN